MCAPCSELNQYFITVSFPRNFAKLKSTKTSFYPSIIYYHYTEAAAPPAGLIRTLPQAWVINERPE